MGSALIISSKANAAEIWTLNDTGKKIQELNNHKIYQDVNAPLYSGVYDIEPNHSGNRTYDLRASIPDYQPQNNLGGGGG